MAEIFVRRDAWTLSERDVWEPTLLAYALAIREMQSRDRADPSSWTYLGGIHGSRERPPRGASWNQCQHGGWFFLPWHRLYLLNFERIVRSTIVSQGGDETWALPYWNIERPGANALPPAFRAQRLPDGSSNPLFLADRAPGINLGARLPVDQLSGAPALAARSFTPPDAAFGGGASGPLHFNSEPGTLERTPHNDVHVVVGGAGWMSDPDLAALDPIFWLHHANIDRLWAEWLRLGDGRANPDDAAWLRQRFSFVDETGRRRRPKVADSLSLGTLGYTYDSLPDTELPPVPPLSPDERRTTERGAAELVGATNAPFELAGADAEILVSIDERAARSARGNEESVAPKRTYLAIEDVDAERNPGIAYQILLVSGEGADRTERHIGNLSLFGIERQRGSAGGIKHPRHVYDISDTVSALARRGTWDGRNVRLAFRPLVLAPPTEDDGRVDPESLDEVTPEMPVSTKVRIGRVSVFFG